MALPAIFVTWPARPASALQPLGEFVAAARAQNIDALEAQATAEQRAGEARQAWARIAPSFTARGTYTRNQEAAEVTLPPSSAGEAPRSAVITPEDQLEATLTLTVPLVDVGAWRRIGAAEATADAARARASGSAEDAEKRVTQAYFQVIGAEATVAAARRALATSLESQAIVGTKVEAGSASDLDAARALAEVERSRQVVASAEQALANARRSIESVSGLRPAGGSAPLPEDDLAPPAPLAALEPGAAGTPAVRAAALEARAAEQSAGAAWAALYPTAAASATERLTNATGFGGREASWSLGVSVTWTLDASSYFAAEAQGSTRAAADARRRRAEQGARDDVHRAFHDVTAQIAKLRSARAEVIASARAAALSRERYTSGAATQLEVREAERDAFSAEVSRIQAAADLAYARALLAIASGRGSTKEVVR